MTKWLKVLQIKRDLRKAEKRVAYFECEMAVMIGKQAELERKLEQAERNCSILEQQNDALAISAVHQTERNQELRNVTEDYKKQGWKK